MTPPSPDTRRLFFALWPDPTVLEHLADVVRPLQDSAPDWLRWQPQSRWHVTVLFLGQCDSETTAVAQSEAARLSPKAVPEPITLTRSGNFGAVLWVGVDTGPWLADLSRRLGRALLPHDQRRQFRGHLTLARARAKRSPNECRSALRDYRGLAWTPRRMALVESHLGPEPRYEDLAVFPLAGGNE